MGIVFAQAAVPISADHSCVTQSKGAQAEPVEKTADRRSGWQVAGACSCIKYCVPGIHFARNSCCAPGIHDLSCRGHKTIRLRLISILRPVMAAIATSAIRPKIGETSIALSMTRFLSSQGRVLRNPIQLEELQKDFFCQFRTARPTVACEFVQLANKTCVEA